MGVTDTLLLCLEAREGSWLWPCVGRSFDVLPSVALFAIMNKRWGTKYQLCLPQQYILIMNTRLIFWRLSILAEEFPTGLVAPGYIYLAACSGGCSQRKKRLIWYRWSYTWYDHPPPSLPPSPPVNVFPFYFVGMLRYTWLYLPLDVVLPHRIFSRRSEVRFRFCTGTTFFFSGAYPLPNLGRVVSVQAISNIYWLPLLEVQRIYYLVCYYYSITYCKEHDELIAASCQHNMMSL